MGFSTALTLILFVLAILGHVTWWVVAIPWAAQWALIGLLWVVTSIAGEIEAVRQVKKDAPMTQELIDSIMRRDSSMRLAAVIAIAVLLVSAELLGWL